MLLCELDIMDYIATMEDILFEEYYTDEEEEH